MNGTDTETTEMRTTGDASADRTDVRARLDRVDDPELDRSIVELEYVERIDIDGGTVAVEFVLPTAWCSPAFAWMMATDIRDEVESLPWVDRATVTLQDHMHDREITTGVNQGLAFDEVFEDAENDVQSVRAKLDEKARFARQYDAIDALLESGVDPEQLACLTRGDVDLQFEDDRASVAVPERAFSVTVPREPLARYIEKAQETRTVTRADDPLFTDRHGEPLTKDTESVEAVRQDARLAVANIDGQAAICAGLHQARNGVPSDDDS